MKVLVFLFGAILLISIGGCGDDSKKTSANDTGVTQSESPPPANSEQPPAAQPAEPDAELPEPQRIPTAQDESSVPGEAGQIAVPGDERVDEFGKVFWTALVDFSPIVDAIHRVDKRFIAENNCVQMIRSGEMKPGPEAGMVEFIGASCDQDGAVVLGLKNLAFSLQYASVHDTETGLVTGFDLFFSEGELFRAKVGSIVVDRGERRLRLQDLCNLAGGGEPICRVSTHAGRFSSFTLLTDTIRQQEIGALSDKLTEVEKSFRDLQEELVDSRQQLANERRTVVELKAHVVELTDQINQLSERLIDPAHVDAVINRTRTALDGLIKELQTIRQKVMSPAKAPALLPPIPENPAEEEKLTGVPGVEGNE